jgi:type IV pilus assembly protein PilB
MEPFFVVYDLMNDKILEILLKASLIDQNTADIARDLSMRGKTLEQALVGARYVSDVDFAKAAAEAYGLEFMDLSTWQMPEEQLKMLPEETIKEFKVLPLGVEDDGTFVYALLNPRDIRAEEAIEFFASGKEWKTKQVIVPSEQIKRLLKIGSVGAEVEAAVAKVGAKRKEREEEKEVLDLKEIIKGAPVARMLTTIMRNAVEQRASDIHIEPVQEESRIRYRIDGVLRTVVTLPVSVQPALVARVKVLSNLKLDETRVPQDGRISQTYGERKIDFRISTLPVVDNEKVAMRILDTTKGAPTLEQLGYRKEHVDVILEEIKKAHGLLLFTGPTGSGKSTTLFACLNLLNNEGVNISTLEDPVEYYIKGVNQSQVRPQIGYTFATGLRSLLRQDPNVIMVGEIRDRETAELAIHASLTGHLIFSTLHTNDSFGIAPRLIDMGVEPFLLAATMNIGVAQRLARRICQGCKEVQEIEPETIDKLKEELSAIPKKYMREGWSAENPVFYHGKGCARCKGSGYSGRVAIAEILLFTTSVRKLVEEGFPIAKVEKEIKEQGMIVLRQDALLKSLEGVTTVEEVFRLSQETEEGEGKDEEKEKKEEKEV